MNSSYDRHFFDVQSPSSLRSAAETVPIVVDMLQPNSVVDVGCGIGTWLSEFLASGVTTVLGIDGDYVDRSRLCIPQDNFVAADLLQPFRIDQRFDLAVSMEVAEHLPLAVAGQFIQSLVDLAPVILFSAAIPNQGGHEHINEQWPDFWANHFQTHGYAPIDCIRPRIWMNSDVRWWSAQNIIVYVEETYLQQSTEFRMLYERFGGTPLPLVHPKTLEKCVGLYSEEYARTALAVGIRTMRRRVLRPIKTATRQAMTLWPGKAKAGRK